MLVEMNISSSNSVKYAEQLRTGKTAEQNDEAHGSRIISRDEYIGSESPLSEPIGLYRQGRDENGDPKIFFDDPQKAEDEDKDKKAAPEKSEEDGAPKEAPNAPEKEKCTADTSAPDKEIKRLREKKQQLEQQLRSACGNESKVRELERKLAQTEYELSEKDNDNYRRQHTKFT